MQPPARIAALTAVVLTAVVWLPVLLGIRGPADLLSPGLEGLGGDVVERDFGPGSVDDVPAYDGQSVYLIARFLPDLDAVAEVHTAPRYRAQRILLPALAAPFGAGTTLLLGLHLWSALGVGLAAWALATIAARTGRDPQFALVASLPLVLPLLLTTTEALATGLLLAGVVALARDRLPAATGWLALAGLARESFLLASLGAVVVLAARRRWYGAALVAASFVPAVGWWLFLQWRLGGTEQTTAAITGFLAYGPAIRPASVVSFLLAVGLCAVGILRWRTAEPFAAATCASFLVSTVVFGSVNPNAILRVPAPALCLGLLALARVRERDDEPEVATVNP